MGRDTKRKLTLRKRHFFVIEKYIEGAKQEEKDVPDLLEAIMRPTCLVEEELRPNSFKCVNLDPKSQKSGFDPKVKSAKMGLPMDPRQFLQWPTLFCDISKNAGCLLYTSPSPRD